MMSEARYVECRWMDENISWRIIRGGRAVEAQDFGVLKEKREWRVIA